MTPDQFSKEMTKMMASFAAESEFNLNAIKYYEVVTKTSCPPGPLMTNIKLNKPFIVNGVDVVQLYKESLTQ